MIWTCKNHDSRVHNYRIHYMSLCILLKLSYIMRGSKLVRELKNWFGHLMSFQQELSHFCNQNTFNLQDWLAFIACWSLIKIFCQNKMLNICWFQNNKKTKARHVSLKDEMWSQNKMQNSKTIWLTVYHHSWISFSGNIWVLPNTFDQHVILKMFGGQYSQWHPPSPTPLVSCSPTFRLNSCKSWNCSLEMVGNPTMTSHLLSGLYHLEIGGCMGFVGEHNSGIRQMLVDELKWQRNVNLGKDIWAIDAWARLD